MCRKCVAEGLGHSVTKTDIIGFTLNESMLSADHCVRSVHVLLSIFHVKDSFVELISKTDHSDGMILVYVPSGYTYSDH